MTTPPTRRTLLQAAVWLGLATGTAGVSGCSGLDTAPGTASNTPSADQLAATRVYDAITPLTPFPGAPTNGPQTATTADHKTHLAALGTPVEPRATASPMPFTPKVHVTAEAAAATRALAEVQDVSPAMAVLLTQIAVSCGAHADALAAGYRIAPPAAISATAPTPTPASTSPTPPRTSTSTSTSTTRRALADLIAAEHAVIYGYGVLTAALGDAAADRARAAWSLHRSRRERYGQWLRDLNGEVPNAAAAYDLRIDGTDLSRTDPKRLAGVLELRMGTHLVSSVAATDGQLRTALAADAIGAGRRAQSWGSAVPALLAR